MTCKMTEVSVLKPAQSFIRFFKHSGKTVRPQREGWSSSMPSVLDLSNYEGCKRRGVACTCGSFVKVLLMGGALFFGQVSSLVANFEVRKNWPATPSVLVPGSPLPAPLVGLEGARPKKRIVVHTGLFDSAAGTLPTKRPVEKVQTGVFGISWGFPDRAQDENPGNVPNLALPGLPMGPGEGNGTDRPR